MNRIGCRKRSYLAGHHANSEGHLFMRAEDYCQLHLVQNSAEIANSAHLIH